MNLTDTASLNTSFVSYDDFLKVDLRVGTIVYAEKVPKSDKLLKLSVDFGETELATLIQNDVPKPEEITPNVELVKVDKPRTILAGIGKSFNPEDLVNKQFLFVINLPPRKMMGQMSDGMILAVGETADKLSLLSPTGMVLPGAKAG